MSSTDTIGPAPTQSNVAGSTETGEVAAAPAPVRQNTPEEQEYQSELKIHIDAVKNNSNLSQGEIDEKVEELKNGNFTSLDLEDRLRMGELSAKAETSQLEASGLLSGEQADFIYAGIEGAMAYVDAATSDGENYVHVAQFISGFFMVLTTLLKFAQTNQSLLNELKDVLVHETHAATVEGAQLQQDAAFQNLLGAGVGLFGSVGVAGGAAFANAPQALQTTLTQGFSQVSSGAFGLVASGIEVERGEQDADVQTFNSIFSQLEDSNQHLNSILQSLGA